MTESRKILWMIADNDPTTEAYAKILRRAFCQALTVVLLSPAQLPMAVESLDVKQLPAWVLTDEEDKHELDREEGHIDFRKLITSIQRY